LKKRKKKKKMNKNSIKHVRHKERPSQREFAERGTKA
jgi:DNA-binding transcriptional regulator YiaG